LSLTVSEKGRITREYPANIVKRPMALIGKSKKGV
jgi:hypothetical protein